MCVATRGLVSAEISLYGPSADLHCGASGPLQCSYRWRGRPAVSGGAVSAHLRRDLRGGAATSACPTGARWA